MIKASKFTSSASHATRSPSGLLGSLKARSAPIKRDHLVPVNVTAQKDASTTSSAAPIAEQKQNLSQSLLQASALLAANFALVNPSSAAPVVVGDLTLSEVTNKLNGFYDQAVAPIVQEILREEHIVGQYLSTVLNNPAIALGVAAALVALGPRVIKGTVRYAALPATLLLTGWLAARNPDQALALGSSIVEYVETNPVNASLIIMLGAGLMLGPYLLLGGLGAGSVLALNLYINEVAPVPGPEEAAVEVQETAKGAFKVMQQRYNGQYAYSVIRPSTSSTSSTSSTDGSSDFVIASAAPAMEAKAEAADAASAAAAAPEVVVAQASSSSADDASAASASSSDAESAAAMIVAQASAEPAAAATEEIAGPSAIVAAAPEAAVSVSEEAAAPETPVAVAEATEAPSSAAQEIAAIGASS